MTNIYELTLVSIEDTISLKKMYFLGICLMSEYIGWDLVSSIYLCKGGLF
jgi:hypothetical protein